MHDDERRKAGEQLETMRRVLRGDPGAIRLCDDLFMVTQIWDDLHDRDREVPPETVNRAFWTAMVEIPQNPFYLRHMDDLRPLLRGWFADWMDSCALERGEAHERSLAFVLRDCVGALICQCAYLVGGYDWMRAVSPDVRAMIHDETLGDYLRGLS